MAAITELSQIGALIAPLAQAGPITVAVMVTSADGRATVNGRVGGLTGEADQQVLLGLREIAAAVVVGGATVQAEGYERLLSDEARARRVARGLAPEPEFVVFTRASPALPLLWDEIRERHADGLIVCEGGPTLLTLIARQRLLDQLVLCISPQLVGGGGRRLINSSPPDGFPLQLEVLALASAGGFVFVRYGAVP